jgi:hypothetical protein
MTLLQTFCTKLGKSPNLALALIGSFSFVLYLFLSCLGPANESANIAATLHRFFALLAALFVLLLFAAMIVRKFGQRQDDAGRTLIIIFGFAVLFRAALLGQAPWLSNDIYRYLWDAQLVDHGVNPYSFSPAADELAEFRDATIYPKMDHKHVHSVYPPFLQVLFWAGRAMSQLLNLQAFIGVKLIFLLIDLSLVLVLFRLLAQSNLDSRWAIAYAWHPLPIVEIAGSGHTDGAGALTLVLTILFLRQRRYFFAASFLALGFLTKFIALLFLPFLFLAAWKDGSLKKASLLAAVFVFIIAVSYAPFATAGENLLSGLRLYSEKWRFNDSVFAIFFAIIHRLLPDWLVAYLMIPPTWDINAETLTTRRIDLALIIAKFIVGFIFAFIYIRVLRWQTRLENPSGISASWPAIVIIILAAFFILSPTLQPWYLIWLLPVLCVGNSMDEFKFGKQIVFALWILSVTVFISYWVLEGYVKTGVWHQSGWVKWIEYGLPFLVWIKATSVRMPNRFLNRP